MQEKPISSLRVLGKDVEALDINNDYEAMNHLRALRTCKEIIKAQGRIRGDAEKVLQGLLNQYEVNAIQAGKDIYVRSEVWGSTTIDKDALLREGVSIDVIDRCTRRKRTWRHTLMEIPE